MKKHSGLLPSSTEHVYREIAECSTNHEVTISREGKEDDDDSDLVLMRCRTNYFACQTELQELEPRLRGIISHAGTNCVEILLIGETLKQLDDADSDLFLLGANMYRDLPTRTCTKKH
ncbi:hypothetical protein KIN20_006783 [Parelaphostrongylus tenuis]|uniref:Uncharacterized protein n=1 Tax=Parelaphostrongylus tenuis TaxID=148309 RepID=A0AAD5QIL4_PARTN|nr:hypothetical protein KIN20_006783 [Parelaphostrongylus tenuis]